MSAVNIGHLHLSNTTSEPGAHRGGRLMSAVNIGHWHLSETPPGAEVLSDA